MVSPTIDKSQRRRRAKRAAQKLAKIMTENAFSLISAIILDSSLVTEYIASASTFQFYLCTMFMTMTFISLLVGCLLCFLSDKVPDSDDILSFQNTLSLATAASLVLAMAAGLCLILPEVLTIIVALTCFTAGFLAYKMKLHVFMLSVHPAKEKRNQGKVNEAAQKLARKVISTASTIISTMILSPSNIFDYLETMNEMGFYLSIIFTMVIFISLVLGFLLLFLSNKEVKSDEMMLIQDKLRLAALASILLAMATGLGLVMQEVLINLGIVCFLVFLFRQQLNLHVFIQG